MPTARADWPPMLKGSQTAVTGMLTFNPGPSTKLLAVAWPMSVSLVKMCISTYGTVALYSVGFVKLTRAENVNDDFVVSRIWRSPILGRKAPTPSRLPRLMAGKRHPVSAIYLS